MANVPNVPGVPALGDYSSGNAALLTSDAVGLISLVAATIFPQWGIYLDGAPVVAPASALTQGFSSIGTLATAFGLSLPVTASFKDVDYDQDWPIATYPVEGGQFQSYDKVQMPFRFGVRLMSGGSQVQVGQFLDLIDGMANDLNLYDVVTPSNVYSDCNVTHYGYRRSAESGVSLVTVDVWFEQIRIATTLSFSNTASPTDAGQLSSGNVTAQTPTLAIQSGLAGGWQ